jgi:hypothetical protein
MTTSPTLESILTDNGLGKWHAKLAAEEIDLENVGKLTDGHLEKLGLPMGTRLKILELFAKPLRPDGPASSKSTTRRSSGIGLQAGDGADAAVTLAQQEAALRTKRGTLDLDDDQEKIASITAEIKQLKEAQDKLKIKQRNEAQDKIDQAVWNRRDSGKKFSCFISHHKRDCAMEARFLKEKMQAIIGKECFLDSDDLRVSCPAHHSNVAHKSANLSTRVFCTEPGPAAGSRAG